MTENMAATTPPPIVILTKVRIQSHEQHRVRLWILDQVRDDGRYCAGPISFCAK